MLLVVTSLLISAFGAWFISRFACSLGLVDLPNERSSHARPVPRGAGIGILCAFIFAALSLRLALWFWLAASFLAIVSFSDDKLNITPKTRLFFQFISAAAVTAGIHSFSGWQTVLLFIFCVIFIVGTANFYNFMDGINGIAGITGLVAFYLIADYSALENIDTLSACMAAACTGFLFFNFPAARVFMGDVGSILIGFLYASLVIMLSADIPSFLTLCSFMFPFYADSLTTLYIRWKNGEELLASHRKHLYQILTNELKYPHWLIAVIYGIVQLTAGKIVLHYSVTGKILALGMLGLLFVLVTVQTRRLASGRA